MRWQVSIIAVLALSLVVSCDQQPVEPVADTAAEIPAFKIGNGPSESGVVLRGETGWALAVTDFESGLQLILGTDIVEYCSGIIDFDVVSFMDVWVNDRPLLSKIHGEDVRTTVWPFTDFDCGLFTTVDPVASGVSDVVTTDNDVFGVGDGNNANAWGFSAHGILSYASSGEPAIFSAHERLKYNNSTGFKYNNKISLH